MIDVNISVTFEEAIFQSCLFENRMISTRINLDLSDNEETKFSNVDATLKMILSK